MKRKSLMRSVQIMPYFSNKMTGENKILRDQKTNQKKHCQQHNGAKSEGLIQPKRFL